MRREACSKASWLKHGCDAMYCCRSFSSIDRLEAGGNESAKSCRMNNRLFSFAGGNTGSWRILRMETITGDALPAVNRLDLISGRVPEISGPGGWVLQG